MKRFICMLTAILLLTSSVPALGAGARGQTDKNPLIEDLILYYGCHGEAAAEAVNGLLGALKATDNRQGALWADIMDYWRYVNTGLVIHTEHLPEDLPRDDSLALVILGRALNADGSMSDELIRRLTVGLDCAAQYPNAYVVCTGGGTAEENKAVTEAGQMGAWLLENGLEADRLIIEDRSLSTIENAQYTLDMLHRNYPRVDAVAIVSSDYHVARGCLLFEAIMLMGVDEKQESAIQVVSNCASPAPEMDYTEDYLRGWQMYNMLQLIGDWDLARQYIQDPEHFPRPVLDEQAEIPDAA